METLVLIADSARARLFAARRSAPWQLLSTFEHPEGAAHEGDLVTDRPGRVHQSSHNGQRSAADPRTAPHEVEAQVFARRLSAALDAAVTARHPRRVVLVAPPQFLGELRAVLSKTVRPLVGNSLDQDLAALPERELPDRLVDYL